MPTKPYSSLLLILLLQLVCWSVQAEGAAINLNCSQAESSDADDCCFSFSYDYNFPQGITSLETKILNPGVTFSAIQYPLGGSWSYETLQNQRRLRWNYQGGNEIPAGEQSVFDFCLSGWNAADSIELVVLWRNGAALANRDTLRLVCRTCWTAEAELTECQPDSSYQYTFDFRNSSSFSVDQLEIREPVGQDFILENELVFTNTLAIGASQSNLELTVSAAADGLTEVCFELTPRHYLTDDIAVDCCTATYCIPLPDCDRCCTPYDDFVAAVTVGFRMEADCDDESLQLQALELSECDRVNYEIVDLGQALVDGNELVTISGLANGTTYEICMTVTREDASGQACYETASLVICQNFTYDCDDCNDPTQIDLTFDCPIELNLVCGCDSMTYFNPCAAENWAGITSWEEDRRCDDEPIDIIPLTVVHLVLSSTAQLNWEIGGLVTYRYFLVQQQDPITEDWSTIDVVDNTTFDYFSPLSGSAVYNYRIVGVAENGKVVFSNEDEIVGLRPNVIPGEGKLWPNPASEQIYLALPMALRAIFRVHNTTGQLVYQQETNNQGQATISVEQWPSGCYFVSAILGNRVVWRKSLIVN